jgi:hypothetical protein
VLSNKALNQIMNIEIAKYTVQKLYTSYKENGLDPRNKEDLLSALPTLQSELTDTAWFDNYTIFCAKALIEAIQEEFIEF